MVQEASGYITAQGVFFDTREQAEFAEASAELHESLQMFATGVVESDAARRQASELILQFINTYPSTILEYIETKKGMEVGPRSDSNAEVPRETETASDLARNDGDDAEHANPENSNKDLDEGSDTGDTGGVAGEEVGTEVLNQDVAEASDHVESDEPTPRRISKDSAKRKRPASRRGK